MGHDRTDQTVGRADNYRYLWNDDTFRQVLVNSFWFAIGAVGGSLVLGLAIALLLNQKLHFRNFARASVFMPTLLSGAAIGIVWAGSRSGRPDVASNASKTFAAPAVIQSGPTKIVYWGSFADQLGEAEKTAHRQLQCRADRRSAQYQYQGTYEETAQKLTAAVAAKQTPDVSLLSDVWWFKFYLNQTLAPLNDLIASNNVDTTDYVDSLYNEGVRDGSPTGSRWRVPHRSSTSTRSFTPGSDCPMGPPSGTI